MKIALLGAAGTGKSTLAEQLAASLRSQGRAVAVVADATGDETRIDAAPSTADIVIADGTALMRAIRGGELMPDGPLMRFALERQCSYDMTLVTGLDLPCAGEDAQREDQLIRTLLAGAGVPYRVVYGSGDDRLRNALAALPDSLAVRPATPPRAWQWQCDKCSDPDCEHRLFTSLTR